MGSAVESPPRSFEIRLQQAGAVVIRYGLVVVLGWIGAAKFATYEAEDIQPLVSSSPLMSWLYSFFSVSMLSAILGVVEITGTAPGRYSASPMATTPSWATGSHRRDRANPAVSLRCPQGAR